MKKRIFYMLDVFAERQYSGNQLAVFPAAGRISEMEMQRIAKEMNYSETTFIMSGRQMNHGYDVRIFTPEEEVPFAGHPTLGTAYVIQREIVQKPVKKIKLNLRAGQIPVAFKYRGNNAERLWMKQNPPEFGRVFPSAAAAVALNLGTADLDSRFPVQEVSTGLPFIMVPLKNMEAVKKAKIDMDRFTELTRDTHARAIFMFSPETYNPENDINARMFAPYFGIAEDPATGSANGCLAGYLVNQRYFDSEKISITVEQGYEMGRPSQLYLRAEKTEGSIEINVGGHVIMVAKGEFV